MADFCKQCSEEIFGEDHEDLKGLCQPGYVYHALCEGCGPCWVDPEGTCLANNCLRQHGMINNAPR